MSRTIQILITLLIFMSSLYAAYNVIEFELSCKNDITSILIHTDGPPIVKDTVLTAPDRLVLYFEDGIHQFKSQEYTNLPAGLVISARSSQYKREPERVTRLEFTLAETPKRHRIETSENSVVITIPTEYYPVIESYKSGRKADIPPPPVAPIPPPVEPEKPIEPEEPEEKVPEPVEEPKVEVEPVREPEPVEKPVEVVEKELVVEEPKIPVVEGIPPEEDRARYFRREIEYDRKVDRDPFVVVSHEITTELGTQQQPNFVNLSLVGIIGTEGDYNALMQDNRGYGYVFDLGDSVLNGIVIAIDDTSITFSINEHGYIRDVSMTMEKEN